MCARTHLTTLRNALKLIEGIRSANQYVLPRPYYLQSNEDNPQLALTPGPGVMPSLPLPGGQRQRLHAPNCAACA